MGFGVRGLRCPTLCGIFVDQGSHPCPLYWQADSYHKTIREPHCPPLKDFLKISFRFTVKLRGRSRGFPFTRVVLFFLPMANLPPHTVITKPLVNFQVHSWCRMLCEFGQMCNDTFPSL